MGTTGTKRTDHLETAQILVMILTITVSLATSEELSVFLAKMDSCLKLMDSLALSTLTTAQSQSKTRMTENFLNSTTSSTARTAPLASSGAGTTECVLTATLTGVLSVKK